MTNNGNDGDIIVRNLRADAATFGTMPPHARVNMNPEFMREMSKLWVAAADEIERLRERLKKANHALDHLAGYAAPE